MTVIPVQVTFRGLDRSDALEAEIRQRAAWLEQFHGGIIGCRVLVEMPHRRRYDGRHFHVRIEVTIPGADTIVVSHEPSLHPGMKDIDEPAHRKDTEVEGVHRYARVAVRDAFDIARRQLQDVVRERRGDVKSHGVAAP